MTMSKVPPGPVSEWLFQAERDLTVARALFAQDFFDWAAFAAQQSGEKAVKAVRLALGTPIETIKVHGVDELLADIGRLHPQPDPILARVSELNAHNAGARYPGVRGATAPASSYGRQHAEDAIKIAEALLAFCDPLCARVDEFWGSLS
jgi:HEPN domain-containing protein